MLTQSILSSWIYCIHLALGNVLASVIGERWIDRIIQQEALIAGKYGPTGELVFRPGNRMRKSAWIAEIVYPAATLCYGWAVDKHDFWLIKVSNPSPLITTKPMFVPKCIANFFFGLGNTLIFNMETTMLTEFVPKRPSSGVTLNKFLRNSLSCIAAMRKDAIRWAQETGPKMESD
jgi:hypothetical protein